MEKKATKRNQKKMVKRVEAKEETRADEKVADVAKKLTMKDIWSDLRMDEDLDWNDPWLWKHEIAAEAQRKAAAKTRHQAASTRQTAVHPFNFRKPS
jgi:hypothetical protein